METRELTCVVCPAGCKITVTLNGTDVVSVTGNTCPRGKSYAESEVTNPVRTLTSSVVLTSDAGEKMLPVKTDRPIPKSTMFEAMKIIHKTKISSPVKTGDIIVKDFIEPGTNLVACKDFN